MLETDDWGDEEQIFRGDSCLQIPNDHAIQCKTQGKSSCCSKKRNTVNDCLYYVHKNSENPKIKEKTSNIEMKISNLC